MKTNKLRDLSLSELQDRCNDLDKQLFNVKFQLHTGRLENTSKLQLLRKDIARVKTLLKEKRG
jgi:large subunit ribosomal protein L29